MALCSEAEVIEIISSSDEESPLKNELQTTDGGSLLDEFILVCKPLLKINQQKAITKLLKDKFSETRKEYTQSEEFRNIIEQHISDLQSKKKSVYVHIQDVKTVLMKASGICRVKLKTVKKGEIETLLKEEQHSNDEPKNEMENNETNTDGHQEAFSSDGLLMTCETISNEDTTGVLRTVPAEDVQPQVEVEERPDVDLGNRSPDQGAGPSTSLNSTVDCDNKTQDNGEGSLTKVPQIDQKKRMKDKGKGSQKQIRKLERVLERLNKAIKRLEERELTLDEMDESDSTHIQEYQLRRRFIKVYNMLCELKDYSPSTGRVIERKIRYEGTRFPEINRRLERLVNKKDFFPDFQDIHSAVYKTNLKKNLGLNKRRVNSIAQEAFEDVGRKLQKRRQQDFILNFSAHSTIDFQNVKDLADKDPELKRKLLENKSIASQKIKEVDEPFVKRQEEYERNGIVMEAAEHSESEAASDGPSDEDDDDDDDGEPALKKRKVDYDEWEKKEENGGENNGDNKEKEETNNQTVNSFSTEPSNSHAIIPVQLQRSLTNQLIQQQQHLQTPTLNSPTSNIIPSSVPSLQNRLQNVDFNHFSIAQSDPFKTAQFPSGNTWFLPEDDTDLQSNKINSIIPSPLPVLTRMLSPPPLLNTAEQAVTSFKVAPPTVTPTSMPLMITNVCSLSRDSYQGPRNVAWRRGETVALASDRNGGLVIGQRRQHKIMMVQSGKNEKLHTSTPIALTTDNSEMDLSAKSPRVTLNQSQSPLASVSSSCSPSSTRPELDVHVVPDVQEVVLASTQSSLKWYTEQRLDNAITPTVRKVTYTTQESSIETTRAGQIVVSKTSSTCNSVQCNHQKQTWKEVTKQGLKQFCIQSTRVSNSGSHLLKTSPRSNSHSLTPSNSPAVPAPHRNAKDIPSTSLYKYKIMGTPKVQMTQERVPITNHGSPQIRSASKWQLNEWQLKQQLKSAVNATVSQTQPSSVSNLDEEDSDVVLISDSESETDEVSQIRADSPDVICISDSD